MEYTIVRLLPNQLSIENRVLSPEGVTKTVDFGGEGGFKRLLCTRVPALVAPANWG